MGAYSDPKRRDAFKPFRFYREERRRTGYSFRKLRPVPSIGRNQRGAAEKTVEIFERAPLIALAFILFPCGNLASSSYVDFSENTRAYEQRDRYNKRMTINQRAVTPVN